MHLHRLIFKKKEIIEIKSAFEQELEVFSSEKKSDKQFVFEKQKKKEEKYVNQL